MAVSAQYAEYVRELFAGFGPVKIRRLFGGAGVYADDVMFALIADEILFLKTDDAFAAYLDGEGSEPFNYHSDKAGRTIEMSYWRIPETAADDPEEACTLARRAYDVALKAKKPKRTKTSKSRGG